MTSSPFPPGHRRRIVTPAWTKNAPAPAPVDEPSSRGRPRKARRRADSEPRAELPVLPGGDGFFITRPDILLAFLGETIAFEVTSPGLAAVPLPDEDDDLPTDDRQRDREAVECPLRCPREIAALCRVHLRFADTLALEVHARTGQRVAVDVVVSAARVGLWHAARRFDPTRNVSFEAFAKRRVAGAILDELRAERVLSRSGRTRSPGLAAMLAACSYASKPEELHTDEDIAWLASWRAASGIGAVPVRGQVSLSGVVDLESIAADDALERAELDAALRGAIAELEPRERELIDRVYFRGQTVAEAIDVTRSWGVRIRRAVLVRLKRAMLRAGYRDRFAAAALPAFDVATQSPLEAQGDGST